MLKYPNEAIMQKAISLARQNYKVGGHAVGAIIVKGDEVVAEAFTTIIRDHDPTAHAEINAIREAAKKLGTHNLESCCLYSTYEPCPMCSAAAIWAKMQGIVYGASRFDETPQANWRVRIAAKDVIAQGVPKLQLYEEFMREECRELLSLK